MSFYQPTPKAAGKWVHWPDKEDLGREPTASTMETKSPYTVIQCELERNILNKG